MALAVVAEQVSSADGRDVNVQITIVVVIAHCDSLAVEGFVETGLFRDILEVPLAIIAVKRLLRRGLGSCPGQGHELTKSKS